MECGGEGVKTSVGWHADSGLEDFSSIAVYQTLLREGGGNRNNNNNNNGKGKPWSVSLRQTENPEVEMTSSLNNNAVYFLLDDFNHFHEHAVNRGTASDETRYSSTHRVARINVGCYEYVERRCNDVIGVGISENKIQSWFTNLNSKNLVKRFNKSQSVLSEVQFDWVAQWNVQGKDHAKKNHWWRKKMRSLCKVVKELLEREEEVVGRLLEAKNDNGNSGGLTISADLYDACIRRLTSRLGRRRRRSSSRD